MPVDSHVFEIYRVIQLIVAPVFLLTAVAAIINVLIGRLARAVDRRRVLEEHLPDYVDARRDDGLRELRLLNDRIRLVLWAVALAVMAGILVCLLIGTAFAGAYISLDLARPVAILFIGAVMALTGCLLLFLREISVAAFSARQTVKPQASRLERKNTTADAK
jgi:MFS family permease